MRHHPLFLQLSLLVVIASTLSGASQNPKPRYKVTYLGTLEGRECRAYAINERGDVVGICSKREDLFDERAFLYQGGTMRDLGTLGGLFSRAYGINDAGQVVGESTLEDDKSWHAFLYSDNKMIDLGSLKGRTTHARGIDPKGQVIGFAGELPTDLLQPPSRTHKAFVYRNGNIEELPALGGNHSSAMAINRNSVIVGEATPRGSQQPRAVLYRDGQAKVITIANITSSGAIDINDKGQVIGMVGKKDGSSRCFLSQNGRLTWLTEFGSLGMRVTAINNQGDIVGYTSLGIDAIGILHRGGNVFDLNSLIPSGSGWQLEDANGINDKGQIVGVGKFKGKSSAYLLTPVAK